MWNTTIMLQNNDNNLGRRRPWWKGGRKEPATTVNAGASSWWGSFTQCGGTPLIMAGKARWCRWRSRLQPGWCPSKPVWCATSLLSSSSLQHQREGPEVTEEWGRSPRHPLRVKIPRWRLWWPSKGKKSFAASVKEVHQGLARLFSCYHHYLLTLYLESESSFAFYRCWPMTGVSCRYLQARVFVDCTSSRGDWWDLHEINAGFQQSASKTLLPSPHALTHLFCIEYQEPIHDFWQ